MTSTTSASPVVAASNPPTFSYAQAAKGRTSATSTPALQSSQGPSGVNTPVKEENSATPSVNGAAASDGGDRSVNGSCDSYGRPDVLAGLESTSKSTTLVDANSSPSSPSFGTASTSTLPKEDDLILSSQTSSVWDRVDRRSHAVDVNKTSDAPETRRGRSGKGRKREKNELAEKDRVSNVEKEPLKQEVPLIAAPLPTVNIWQQRMAVQPVKAKPSTPVRQNDPEGVGASDVSPAAKPSEMKRRGKIFDAGEKAPGATQNGGAKDLMIPSKGLKKGSDTKEDPPGKRVGTRGNRLSEKDERFAASQLPPPVEDAISWPTPETALEEEKRKAKVHVQEKSERDDNVEAASNKPRQKKEWVPVPYTPSVTFNTPMPSRGGRGRGGGRGGREASGRASHAANGSISGDKSLPSMTTTGNNDGRDRVGEHQSVGRATSIPPSGSSKRPSNDGGPATRDQRNPSTTLSSDKPKTAQADTSIDYMADYAKVVKLEQTLGGSNDGQSNNTKLGNELRAESNNKGSENSKDASNLSRDNPQVRDGGRADRGRGGFRGRGGYNNITNNQPHTQHAFTNGSGHGPAQSNGYALRQNGPYSPPLQQQPFGNPYVPAPGRGRGGSRSQSIPNNGIYGGRYPNGNGSQLPPLQTSGVMYDFQPMPPMTALPYSPYVDQYSVLNMVTMQLEYYFSIDNLCKDVFLRKHMDSQGFVFLSFIAGFKRITALTQDFELLRFACYESEIIDIIKGEDGIDRLRRKEGWEQWVLPMADRDESTRIEGPQIHYRQNTHQRPPQLGQIMSGQHALSPPPFSPSGTDVHFAQFRGVPVPANMNGNGHFQPEVPLSAAVPDFAPAIPGLNGIPDPLESETTFTDEEVYKLTLVYHSGSGEDLKSKLFERASMRTFSNGSIDVRTMEDLQDNQRQGRGLTNGSHTEESSPSRCVMWKKGQRAQVPLGADHDEESYQFARAKALGNRELSATGEVHSDMKLLYEFWAHFLCRNFNPKMYREFRKYAIEDATQKNAMDGVNNLILYYDETLKSQKKVIPETLARHYVELVKSEDPNSDRPGFAKLRAAWRNGALDLKSRKRIDSFVDPQLREELER